MQNKKDTRKWGLCVLAVVTAALVLTGTIFVMMQRTGKNRLYAENKNERPELKGEEAETETEESLWREGDIRYEGKIYRYNEDMLTFLFLGIDKEGSVEKVEEGNEGGQSDAIFLMCINPHTQEISVIAVNRDTMTDVDVYTEEGNYLNTVKAQIALQHGYGDGAEISCERTLKAVRKLFYNIPIHGYCSINIGAIPLLGDAVGGVEVTLTEELKLGNHWYAAGDTVLLKGSTAHEFLRHRGDAFASAGNRLERQKQYVTAYVKKAAEKIKEDPAMVIGLYQTLSKYMVTDVSLDKVTYLASQITGYTLSGERMYSLQGETVMGEKFEEFYPDEEAIEDLILQVFYEEVKES